MAHARSILFNIFLFGTLTVFLLGAVPLLPLPVPLWPHLRPAR